MFREPGVVHPFPTLSSVPNAPKTPKQNWRVPQEDVDTLRLMAGDEGITVSEIVRRLIHEAVEAYRERTGI